MNGGEPVGYVITTPEGAVIYHAGETNVFGDMKVHTHSNRMTTFVSFAVAVIRGDQLHPPILCLLWFLSVPFLSACVCGQIISELYAPNIALLPIGGIFTMAEKEASYALKNLLTSVKTVVPMHFGACAARLLFCVG